MRQCNKEDVGKPATPNVKGGDTVEIVVRTRPISGISKPWEVKQTYWYVCLVPDMGLRLFSLENGRIWTNSDIFGKNPNVESIRVVDACFAVVREES